MMRIDPPVTPIFNGSREPTNLRSRITISGPNRRIWPEILVYLVILIMGTDRSPKWRTIPPITIVASRNSS